jgi:hypothetical protein
VPGSAYSGHLNGATEVGSLGAAPERGLERLLEAFAIGSLPKDLLQQRADEYRQLLNTLEPRRDLLEKELADNTLSDEDIEQLIGTIEDYRQSLQEDWAEADYETRRAFVEALGLYCTVTVEQDQQVLYIKWLYNKFRIVMTAASEANLPNLRSRRSTGCRPD